ncbi:MAG: hypothetical protein ACOYN0_14685 [Phycisphaerales bacterium]
MVNRTLMIVALIAGLFAAFVPSAIAQPDPVAVSIKADSTAVPAGVGWCWLSWSTMIRGGTPT